METVLQPTLSEYCKTIFQNGTLTQVNVSMWGMSAQLDSTDLKIAGDIPKIFHLGHKLLVNPAVRAKFKLVESRARNYLRSNSFSFPVAQAHFVPNKQIVKVTEKLNEYKAEFDALTEEFLQNYEKYKEEVLNQYEGYRASLEPYYPQLDSLRAKFGFHIGTFEIAFPEKLTELNLGDMKAREESTSKVTAEYEKRMQAQYTHALEQMNGFVAESVQTLRAGIVEVSQHVVNKIRNGDVVTKTNLNTILEKVDNFKALNFFNDTKVEAELDNIKKIASSDVDFKSNQGAIEALNKALVAAIDATKEVSDVDELTGEFFRKIEL